MVEADGRGKAIAKITYHRPPCGPRIIRAKPPARDGYPLADAFLEALMYLPDQPARSLALDALTGIGPGSEDTRETARTILKAARRLGWERWQARAKLAEHAGVKA